jgi:hypothetical protein
LVEIICKNWGRKSYADPQTDHRRQNYFFHW